MVFTKFMLDTYITIHICQNPIYMYGVMLVDKYII